MARIQYRPEIDGLRAVAVVPVILFHMGFRWAAGGFIGVDVFFVISGFLISSILLDEFENKTFSFPGFWARRVRRIFPALMTMLLATSLISVFLPFKRDTVGFGFQGISSALSFANVTMRRQFPNYWGAGAYTTPFLHTWSLSVEEQFYLLYPLLLVFLLRLCRNRSTSSWQLSCWVHSCSTCAASSTFPWKRSTSFRRELGARLGLSACTLDERRLPSLSPPCLLDSCPVWPRRDSCLVLSLF